MGKRKTILVIVSLIVLAAIGGLLALWNPTPPPAVVMPVPNGYTAFVQAASQVQKQTWDFEKMSQEELQYLADANSNALHTARLGLAEKCRVPMEFSMQYLSNHMAVLGPMKTIAEAFLAEGRLAELEKRTNDAARAYLDAARLGINSRRGGIVIDGLIGIAMEAMGTSQLQKIVPNLDTKTSAEIARELQAADSDQESWEQICQNDKNWARLTQPSWQRDIATLFGLTESKASRADTKKRFDAQEARTRRLILDLAAHAYELEKGHRPTNVAELIPDYLKAAPADPLTGKEMTLTP